MQPATVIASLNRLSVWRCPVRVWDFTLTPPTCDRYVYLWMHRLGHVGREEQEFFSEAIQPSGRGVLNRNAVHSGDNRLGAAPTLLHSDQAFYR